MHSAQCLIVHPNHQRALRSLLDSFTACCLLWLLPSNQPAEQSRAEPYAVAARCVAHAPPSLHPPVVSHVVVAAFSMRSWREARGRRGGRTVRVRVRESSRHGTSSARHHVCASTRHRLSPVQEAMIPALLLLLQRMQRRRVRRQVRVGVEFAELLLVLHLRGGSAATPLLRGRGREREPERD